MKAIVYTQYGEPEVLRQTEIEKPTPAENEVLVKVHATSVTVADVRSRAFRVPLTFWLPARLALGVFGPRQQVLGAELAGDVVSVGAGVGNFKPGDAVMAATVGIFGGYAEYVCLPADGRVECKPTNLSYAEAATLPVGARTALHYLRKADVQPGLKILVYGASGSVGTYAVQLAKAMGAEVTGVCSSKNMSLVESLGADKVLDYTAEDWLQQLESYAVVLDTVDKLSFNTGINSVKANGFYLNVAKPFPSLAMLRYRGDATVALGENVPNTREMLDYIRKLVEAGKLKPVIDRTYSLDEIVAAHRFVDHGHKVGNVAIIVSGKED